MNENTDFPTYELEFPHFRPWRELALLCLILMEVSWVVPWYRSMTPVTQAVDVPRAFLVLFCLVWISHLVFRLANFLKLKTVYRQGIILALVGFFLLLGEKFLLYPGNRMPFLELLNQPFSSLSDLRKLIPTDFLVSLVIIVACWRGISLAQSHVEPQMVLSHFQIGYVMFIIFVLFNTIVTGETPGFLLYVFLASGLLALGAARISVLSSLRGSRQSKFDRRWFVGMGFVSFVVVALAAWIADITVKHAAKISQLIGMVVGGLALLAWFVFGPIILTLIRFARSFSGTEGFVNDLVKALAGLQTSAQWLTAQLNAMLERLGIVRWIQSVAPILRITFLVGVFVLVLAGVMIWSLIDAWKARRRELGDEERTSILDLEDWLGFLSAALRQRAEKLRNKLSLMGGFRRHQRLLAAARIRRIYASLMELCTKLGNPRPKSQTPLEFLPTLQHSFPGLDREIELITRSYLRVRYGLFPETTQEVETIESAWRRISAEGQARLNSRSKK